MRSTKKTALRHRSVTVSLFQSHVFKHEFFLRCTELVKVFPVARSLFPLNPIQLFTVYVPVLIMSSSPLELS